MLCRTSWRVLLLAGLLAAATLGAQAQLIQGEGNGLPEGTEKEIVSRACTTCHSLERISASYRTLQEWQVIMDNMVLNGADVMAEEVEGVVQYLANNFGPANAQARLDEALQQESSGPAATQQPPFIPVAGVYQLMKAIIIPNAEVVWNVAMEAPQDDQEWTTIQNSALTLAESGNLLMIGSRAKDQGDWVKAAQALVNEATVALRAAEAKNVDVLLEAGDRMLRTCSGCHRQYKQSPPR